MIAAVPNEARVVGQTVRRVRPCHRCGTLDGVTITWAVPLDRGGRESEWNQTVMCGPCRRQRKFLHLNPQMTGAVEGKERKRLAEGRSQRVEVGAIEFDDVSDAAKFFGKSKQTIYNWIYQGRHDARYIRDKDARRR